MAIGEVFWILMIIWLVFGFWQSWGNQWAIGGSLLQWILFALLGWKVFGFIIH